MAWAALGKGLMGAGRVASGAARTAGRGARMARRMFKRKGGRDINKPASEQTVDVEATEVKGVRPSYALVPFAAGAGAISTSTSTSSDGDDVEEIAIRIKTNLISVEKLLKGSYAAKEKARADSKAKDKKDDRDKQEEKVERKKPQGNILKAVVPKQVKSFWETLKNFIGAFFLSVFLGQLMKLQGPLFAIMKVLAKVVDIGLSIIGFIFNILVSIVDGCYKIIDGIRGVVKNLFGEKGLEVFDSFLGTLNKVLNAIISVGMIFGALGGFGMVTKLMSWLKGGTAVKTVLATTAKTVGGTATKVAGIGAGATAAVVAGAGLLASGLGEGAAQLNKWGLEREKNWKKKAKDKWWTDPRKYFWAAAAGIMTVLNRFFGVIGGLLDIIGAPFRMIIELIRFPFLDEAGKKKQAENLAKFDARIREQFRQGLNAIDFLGLISDDKGSWGSLYGEKGTDGMGYTKDGESVDKETEYDKIISEGGEIKDHGNVGGERIIEINYPDKKVGGFLGFGGKVQKRRRLITSTDTTSSVKDIINKNKSNTSDKSQGDSIKSPTGTPKIGKMTPYDYLMEQGLKVEDLEDGMERFVHVYNPKLQSDDGTYQGTKVSGTYPGKDQLSTEEFINSNPNFSIKKLKKIANDTKPQGIMRGVTGALDWMTGGMFDFDQRNREGAPKDFGIRRIAGGLADAATFGLTDFDKRGAGTLQVNPMFGGKDKAWGAADEQAKRGEAQSGFGLKRGIGGALDFATLGMFDFDKQNRKGAPKDFGIRRIAGGLADYATLGITDFDKRGAGVMQVNPMFGGKDKAWGSRNEQAKRGEKQSGFGLKRGIGGALDFATLGMFDFDKQNPAGSPKGFGPFRMLAGLTDWMTMGLTDFDKRGAGNFQFDPISGGKDKRWGTERQRPMRSEYQQRKIDNLRSNNTTIQLADLEEQELTNKVNQLQMESTRNPDGSITSRGSGRLLGGELFIPGQALTERQYHSVKFGKMAANKKYSDDVLRSYAAYENNGGGAEPEIVIVRSNTTRPMVVRQNQGGLLVLDEESSNTEESYASYQGH